MTTDMLLVFSIVGIASVLFASGRVRLDVVALLVVPALGLLETSTSGLQLSSSQLTASRALNLKLSFSV